MKLHFILSEGDGSKQSPNDADSWRVPAQCHSTASIVSSFDLIGQPFQSCLETDAKDGVAIVVWLVFFNFMKGPWLGLGMCAECCRDKLGSKGKHHSDFIFIHSPSFYLRQEMPCFSPQKWCQGVSR